jgi:transcriptional regulator with XRE-family HTH domain
MQQIAILLGEFYLMKSNKRKKDSVKLFLEQVGENIRNHRIKRGFTLAELGEDVGLDKSNMLKIEQGRNITLVTLLKISAFLDVPPAKLIQHSHDILMEDTEKYMRKR